mmetsp:Transcript_5085/g.21746  ORF Transcript_5085/g.21746 Transcript_5085/m.21746 type:complete len:330 (+) Transcript_5085:290-1279(+)
MRTASLPCSAWCPRCARTRPLRLPRRRLRLRRPSPRPGRRCWQPRRARATTVMVTMTVTTMRKRRTKTTMRETTMPVTTRRKRRRKGTREVRLLGAVARTRTRTRPKRTATVALTARAALRRRARSTGSTALARLSQCLRPPRLHLPRLSARPRPSAGPRPLAGLSRTPLPASPPRGCWTPATEPAPSRPACWRPPPRLRSASAVARRASGSTRPTTASSANSTRAGPGACTPGSSTSGSFSCSCATTASKAAAASRPRRTARCSTRSATTAAPTWSASPRRSTAGSRPSAAPTPTRICGSAARGPSSLWTPARAGAASRPTRRSSLRC